MLPVKGMSSEQPQYHFWLRGNLHLHNKCYVKSRAAFICQLSYSGYSYLLSGILPGKNRKFFIQFTNYICHVQAPQSLGNCSEAYGWNLLVEDGELCSAVQEALLALIIHEEARVVGERRGKMGLGYFFRFLCSLHACCHEPPSIISLGYLFGMRSEKTRLGKAYT